MRHYSHPLLRWTWLLGSQFKALMTGGVLVLSVGAYDIVSRTTINPLVYVGIAVITFVQAAYLTWKQADGHIGLSALIKQSQISSLMDSRTGIRGHVEDGRAK